jgi:hypothetical protein
VKEISKKGQRYESNGKPDVNDISDNKGKMLKNKEKDTDCKERAECLRQILR